MVARIIRGKDIIGLIKYNEKEKSSILYSQLINDIKNPEDLTLQDKIQGLQAYINLNPKISKPTFHVSLNPDPEDILSDEQLTEIGREYLERMNYGQQPFIIYKHEDIERTHIHLVSVSVRLDGKAISSCQDRYRSEEIRKILEVKYGLIQASDKIKNSQNIFQPINIQAIEYGKTDTKSAIAAVVRSATRDYRFSSLTEYKTLLQQYNVVVDEVKDEKDREKTLGLFYAVVNPQGEKVGNRIKASSIGKEVGFTALLDKFRTDEQQVKTTNLKTNLSERINRVLKAFPYLTPADFAAKLKDQGIQAVYRHSKDKRLYGVTFIDSKTKIVINGRTLGQEFSANRLNQRFAEATLSGQDLQKANQALTGIYNEYRKTDDQYYYESSLIKALPELQGKLFFQLLKQAPQIGEEQAKLAVRNFIQYRQRQLPQIQEKEIGYFKVNAPALVHLIQSNHALTFQQKLSFLYANNITFSQKGPDLVIQAAKSPEVGYSLPNINLFELFRVPTTGEKLAVAAKEIPVFRKSDRDIVKVLSHPQEERNYGDLKLADKIDFLHRSPVLPYLTKADKHLLFSYANISYVEGAFQNMEKGLNYQQTFSKMLENGLLIKPLVDETGEIISYYIGYYKTPESSFVKAEAKLTDYLKSNNLDLNTAARISKLVFRQLETGEVKISPKYSMIVKLNQAWQKSDLKATHHVLNFIHRINKPLATRIEKSIAENLRIKAQNNDAEKIQTKDIIPLILKEVAAYPADTLREPSFNSPYISRYRVESKQGASLMESIGTMFHNLADAVFGNESGEKEEHKPEQNRKKKRRRPRW